MSAQPTPTPSVELETSSYFFNARELARLAAYRAAVVARFYTDQCEPTSSRPSFDSSRLLKAVTQEPAA